MLDVRRGADAGPPTLHSKDQAEVKMHEAQERKGLIQHTAISGYSYIETLQSGTSMEVNLSQRILKIKSHLLLSTEYLCIEVTYLNLLPLNLNAGTCRPYGQVGQRTTCKGMLPKSSFSVNHGFKNFFNSVNFTLTIYSFCRLSDYG